MTGDHPPPLRIYTKIVGDLMHVGHVRFFKAARALGSHLTVCVVPDSRVAAAKRMPVMTTAERVELVESCRYVDAVITDGPIVISHDFMLQNHFDIYAFGAKDEAEHAKKLADCRELPAHMKRRVKYTDGISTTDLIRRIEHRLQDARL
jgi:cytidyltransferase-like protein